jgi:hypothetical protein
MTPQRKCWICDEPIARQHTTGRIARYCSHAHYLEARRLRERASHEESNGLANEALRLVFRQRFLDVA